MTDARTRSFGRDVLDTGYVLIVGDKTTTSEPLRAALESTGHDVDVVGCSADALHALSKQSPDVVVADFDVFAMDGFEFIDQLRSAPAGQHIPLIFLSASDELDHAVRALTLGADDYIRKPIHTEELLARVTAKVQRPSIPAGQRPRADVAGVVTETRFREELDREIRRSDVSNRAGCLAAVDVAERSALTERFGPRADQDLRVQLSASMAGAVGEFDVVCLDGDGRLFVLMPDTSTTAAKARLAQLSAHVMRASSFTAAGEAVNVTPIVGFTTLVETLGSHVDGLIDRATAALEVANTNLDLQPVEWEPRFAAADGTHGSVPTRTLRRRLRTPLQVLITFDVGVLLPFIALVLFDRAGWNIAPIVYVIVVVSLLFTAAAIWIEGFLALDPVRPPPESSAPFPAASAIIAAYLPNEAGTIVQTVEEFLRIDYPGPFEIVLAYNTPQSMPIEQVLARISERDPRFVAFRVDESTSKAQNVNAALGRVNGEFVGVFDADHHPDPGAFRRAWRWLANGYDIVQGHCVVRNGDASLVARTVAVEFESIYAVSHPGRARLHQFGIFGGSNGYWRTDQLRKVRMHGFMLTEDIDSSLRAVEDGARIASDPALVSRELAPTNLHALWNQRMRWAQGWFQVSRRHLVAGLRSHTLNRAQKLGFLFLLGWRELYPWVSLQILPLMAFYALQAGGITRLDFFIPFFVLTTLFTLSVGPGQTYFAYRLAVPELRRRRPWFLAYLVVSSVFYTEMKNVIGRVAQIKELTGDRQWRVTPRKPDDRPQTSPVGSR